MSGDVRRGLALCRTCDLPVRVAFDGDGPDTPCRRGVHACRELMECQRALREYRETTGATSVAVGELVAAALTSPEVWWIREQAARYAAVADYIRTATRAATVDVADHGAVGDGTTDDTAAIQAAVAAASRMADRASRPVRLGTSSSMPSAAAGERVTRPVRLDTSRPVMGTAADRLARLAEAVGIDVGQVAASVAPPDAHVVRHRTPSDPTCWGPGPREVGCYAEGVDPLGLCVPCRAAIEARTRPDQG